MTINKHTKWILILSVVLMVISIIGQFFMQTGFMSINMEYHSVSLKELGSMITKNCEESKKNVDITFWEDPYATFSFLTFIPDNASAENPVPAIVLFHGGWNTKEKQSTNYIELARRGFVVVVPDLAGMGQTDTAVSDDTGGSYGATAAVEYAMSLPYVDENQIGVAGHSNGNREAARAITLENETEHNNHRIKAFFLLNSVGYINYLNTDVEGLFLGEVEAKYDEWDVDSDNALHYLEHSDTALSTVQRWNPEYNSYTIPEGEWISSDGSVTPYDPDSVNGAALDIPDGVAIWNPAEIHNQGAFSKNCSAYATTTYYAAFGVPSGAEYISPSSQIWPFFSMFRILGLIGLVLFIFPVVSILADTKLFSGLKRQIPSQAELPSIKKPENWISILAMIVITTVYSYSIFTDAYVRGYTSVFDSTYSYSPLNPFLYYFMAMTIFGLGLTLADYAIKRLIHRKDGTIVANPFESGKISGWGEFFRCALFALVTAVIWMLPVYVAFYGFQACFRIWEIAIYPDSIAHFYIFATKYLPLFTLFFIPMAISNVGMRFKELPDWVSSLIAGIANSLGISILAIVQYSSIVKNGVYYIPDGYGVMAGMVAITTPPVLILASFIVRHVYKKTGNTWVAALTNGLILGLLFFTYMSA